MTYARVVIVLHLYLLEQCLNPVLWTSNKTCNFVTFYEFLIHLGMHHTCLFTCTHSAYYSFTSTCSVLHWYITGPLCNFRIFLHLSFSCEVFVIWAVFRIHWYFSGTSRIHLNFLLVFPVCIPIPSPIRPFLAGIVYVYVRAPPYANTTIYHPCSVFFRRRWKKSTAIGKDRRGFFLFTSFLFVCMKMKVHTHTKMYSTILQGWRLLCMHMGLYSYLLDR